MIKVDDIYAATNCGLEIILYYYPSAREAVDENKAFKRRPSENTPSARIRLFGKDGEQKVYKVTDFGDGGQAKSPIDICMEEENLRFNEAVLTLASRYNVTDELNFSVNKPDIRQRPATVDEKDGTTIFELEEGFTDAQLKVMGPRVKQEHLETLHWHSAKYIGYVKNREVTLKYATDTYPIFMRECLVKEAQGDMPEVKFFKIYEPLNPDKGFRFNYTPKGVKPKVYLHGLEELKKVFREMNAKEEASWNSDTRNEGKPYKEKKLPEAFICSGERDALCVKSFGYLPLWFNSESEVKSPEIIKEIMKYVDVLYNIPDIDSTGVKMGRDLALKYIDIVTIWLPDWLKTYRDNRGKSRKDFRDWCDLRNKNEDFRNLMTLAMPARFWTSRYNEKQRTYQYEIDTDCLHYFLKLNGFYVLHDDNSSTPKFIKITGNVVKPVKASDIRTFLRSWTYERALPRDIRNLILNSTKLSGVSMENLHEIDLDFTSYTKNSQLFFFQKTCAEVTGKEIKIHPLDDGRLTNYVWEANVLKHDVKLMDDMFVIHRSKSEDGTDLFDIDVKDSTSSHFFGYVINSCRRYWRKELEEELDKLSPEEAEKYKKEHRFDIEGPLLTESEREYQKRNLINKIFAIGYMLHRYKSPSRPWAPEAMDGKVGGDDECNGRSGKSFLFKSLGIFLKTVKISGRNAKLTENQFMFDQVTKHTDMILIDDCDKYLNMGVFYDNITSDITVNPKGQQTFNIPFEDAPKFAFTTNYIPSDFDPSTEARLLYMVFFDYYHQRTDSTDYRETRSIRDDFNKDLFGSMYSEAEWQADINFFLQCCKFYLSLCEESVKIQPPMDCIISRRFKFQMGNNFEDWAQVYFDPDGEHVNTFVVRDEAFTDFKNFSQQKNWTMQRFTKALKAFCVLCPYVEQLNPEEFLNNQGRIVRKDKDGKSADMIYLKTIAAPVKTEEELNNNTFVPDEIPF